MRRSSTRPVMTSDLQNHSSSKETSASWPGTVAASWQDEPPTSTGRPSLTLSLVCLGRIVSWTAIEPCLFLRPGRAVAYVFGGPGQQTGLVVNPVAIDMLGDKVLVLDRSTERSPFMSLPCMELQSSKRWGTTKPACTKNRRVCGSKCSS